MKTIYTIKQEDGSYAWDSYKQDMKYWIFEELAGLIYIEQENKRFTDDFCTGTDGTIMNDWEHTRIEAKGYSQGDYQAYSVSANVKAMTEEQNGFYEDVKTGLSRLFTHQNDYYVTAKQVNEDGWEKAYDVDCNVFDINWEEFPSDELIIQTFCEHEGIKASDDIIIEYKK